MTVIHSKAQSRKKTSINRPGPIFQLVGVYRNLGAHVTRLSRPWHGHAALSLCDTAREPFAIDPTEATKDAEARCAKLFNIR